MLGYGAPPMSDIVGTEGRKKLTRLARRAWRIHRYRERLPVGLDVSNRKGSSAARHPLARGARDQATTVLP